MATQESEPRTVAGPSPIRYRERLGAPIWVWIVLMIGVLALTVALGAALGAIAAVATLIIFGSAVTWCLVVTALTIEVTDTELKVGRAHIGWEYVGLVATLDESSTRLARGAGVDPRAFAAMRSLTAKKSVTIEVCDDDDPHPYWLMSTRHPDVLGEQIRKSRQNYFNR